MMSIHLQQGQNLAIEGQIPHSGKGRLAYTFVPAIPGIVFTQVDLDYGFCHHAAQVEGHSPLGYPQASIDRWIFPQDNRPVLWENWSDQFAE
jgi:hypothetical protein